MLDEERHSWVEWEPANGEVCGEFCDRALLARQTIRDSHLGETVLVVGHAEVNTAILAQAVYADTTNKNEFTQENACLNELKGNTDDEWQVETVNDIHLS